MRKTATSLALALTIVLRVGAAEAQTSVAVLGVEAVDAPLNMASLLALALQDRVRQVTGYKLVAGKELEEIKLVFGCVDEQPSCMASAGRSLNAAKLTWGVLKRTRSGYHLTIKWLDVGRARVDRFVSENIGRRELTRAQAAAVIERLTRSFLVSSTGTIKISCGVEGAQVSLGARAVATTDSAGVVLRGVAAGTHLVRIAKEGYEPWTQQVLVQGGGTTEVDARLVATILDGEDLAPDDRPDASSNTGWKIAFWSSAALTLGLGAGLGVSGWQVLRAEDDKEQAIREYREDPARCPDGCPDKYSGPDACSDASAQGVETIADACDRGDQYAILTNALIAATAGVAVITGYLYYKAYVAVPARPAKPSDGDEAQSSRVAPATPTWMLSPSVGADGAGLGFSLRF